MNKRQIEVEVKVYLGTEKNADAFLKKLRKSDPSLELLETSQQLNHYYLSGDGVSLTGKIASLIDKEGLKTLENIFRKTNDYSLRTRYEKGETLLVVKHASHGNDNIHGHGRYELELRADVPHIDHLDKLITDSNFAIQSKWSRERRLYRYKDINVALDRNAGYGYIAELEKLVYNKKEAEKARKQILTELKRLNIKRLSNTRLGRMFKYYNENWPKYYKTDKTFVVK